MGPYSGYIAFCYRDWLKTQYKKYPLDEKYAYTWLINVPELFSRRAPGNTCLTAIENGANGTIDNPINDSKGCGGIMRVSPIGLYFETGNRTLAEIDIIGAETAAITHGHELGYIPAAGLTEKKTSIMGENETTSLIDEDTVVMGEEETTILIEGDTAIMEDKETDLIPEDTPTEMIRSDKPVVLIDARPDIYSMGATIYHLLTGKKPESSLGRVTPLTEYKNIKISDGMLYIVQRCMEKKPEKRFQTADDLLKALTKINKLDRRYKAFRRKQEFSYIFVLIMLSASVIAVKTGIDTLAREKEEKYDFLMEQAVEYIENEQYSRVKEVYDEAVKLFENENEAYRMYALALYKQQDYPSCIEFVRDTVETNSHLIKDNEMAELYAIIGNCYYELGEYELACRYMKNAIDINDTVRNYYRDYAVFLARNGDMGQAG